MSIPGGEIDHSVIGLTLYKFVSGDLIACERVSFANGASAVDTVLRRASVSGHVKLLCDDENMGEYFADAFDADHNTVQSIALDRKSYSALKNRWMRCRIERYGKSK